MQMFTTDRFLVIVMEHVNGMPFSTLLSKLGPLNEEEARYAFRQVIDAVSYCHHQVDNLLRLQLAHASTVACGMATGLCVGLVGSHVHYKDVQHC